MKPHAQWFALIALALATSAASAQFVKGNEAVRVMPDGSNQVEMPPLPTTGAHPHHQALPPRLAVMQGLAHGGDARRVWSSAPRSLPARAPAGHRPTARQSSRACGW